MASKSQKVCILNSYEIAPNYGGPVGVFREAFTKVCGVHWDIRTYAEANRPAAQLRKAWHRLCGPLTKGYSRQAHLHRQLSHDAAFFESIPGIADYEAIWFSDLYQYIACRPSMPARQKAVLQLHNPALPSIEAIEQPWLNARDRELIERAQRWALRDADLVVIANQGAEAIYGELLAGRPVAHLQNAMAGEHAGEAPMLSPANTNFLFVGRRNSLKGFDLLIPAFRAAHSVDSSLRLYLIGDGAREQMPGVVDLQFSKVPQKWIAASSCVVIPNRSSYLDLNLLQALSLDAPVMLTCTEGHQCMSGAGPAIYEIQAASVEALRDAMLDAPRWLRTLGKHTPTNREIFERDYGLDGFAQRLDEICAGVVTGELTDRVA
jgi:glycosyltransferase involved in cell wall biosynthesis